MLERFLDLRIAELAAHEALDREDGVLRVGDRLAARHLTNDLLAGLRVDGDDRGRQAAAFSVLEDGRIAGLHDCDDRVGRAEVDAQNFCHGVMSLRGAVTARELDHGETYVRSVLSLVLRMAHRPLRSLTRTARVVGWNAMPLAEKIACVTRGHPST